MSWDWRAVRDSRLMAEDASGMSIGKLLYDATYECAFCRGRGERPAGATCPVCRRSGTVSFEPPVVTCGYCHGRGEVPARSGITCPVCKGKGKVSVKEPIQICRSCRGRGRKSGSALYCIRCRGVGAISVSSGGGVDRGWED